MNSMPTFAAKCQKHIRKRCNQTPSWIRQTPFAAPWWIHVLSPLRIVLFGLELSSKFSSTTKFANFPPAQVTSWTKFWSGSKRYPHALSFDLDSVCENAEMKSHSDFVVAAANLCASMHGSTRRTDEAYYHDALKNVIVPDFSLADDIKIASTDDEEENNNSSVDTGDSKSDDIWNSLLKPSKLAGFQLNEIDFDQDIISHYT